MQKDFDTWNRRKKHIESRGVPPYYHEREIWWCALGINIGYEQDGTGSNYDRPILIIRGFNSRLLFGVALTGRMKLGRYYEPLGKIEDREASVILSQVRLIDSKRLVRKIGTLDSALFQKVTARLKRTLFE